MHTTTDSRTLTPAPLWRRLAAMLYDTFLVLALLIMVGFINLGTHITFFGESRLRQMTEQGYTLDGPLFYTALITTVFIFFAYCWMKKGQTLGMQAWRIWITNDDQQPITFKQTLIRFLIAIPAIFLFFSGVIWMKIDPQQKSWQDRISRTRTVMPIKQKQH